MSSVMRIALLVIALLNFSYAQQNIYVWNSRLFIDGAEYLVKGVDYNPSPIGQGTVNFGTGYGGTGFCSYKTTPYNESKSACYDSDYFDGSPWPQNKSVQGFLPLWQRDFPTMKAYGINTIRMYNTNPTSLAASKTYTNLFSSPTGKDHSQFMTYAGSFGFKIAYPLYMYNNDYQSLPAPQFKRYLRWQIDECGNFSSLLYWVFGNEQSWTWDANQVNNTASQTKFNDYTDYIKRYTYSKWNRWIPVSMSIQWNYGFFETLMKVVHLDFFSANIFTTSIGGYDQLMTLGYNSSTQYFEGFNVMSCKYSKPFLITEYGTTASVGRTYVNQSINLIWFNILRNVQYGLLGGVYFEHTDEPSYGNKNFGAVQLNISYSGGLSSNMTNVFIPDRVTLKQQYYDLLSGTVNGTAYNYNANEWAIIGRQPYTVSNVPDRCSSYKQCPGTVAGSPQCSGNGMCNRTIGQCSCGTGWTGSDCNTPVCPNSCSGQGICSTLVSPPECFCNPPYYGPSCQNVASSQDESCPGAGPFNCTYGNGVCNNVTWTCACWPGWTGLDCAVTDLKGLSSTTSSSSFSVATTSSSTFGVSTSKSSTTVAASTSSTTSVAQTTSSSVTAASSVSATSTTSTTAATSTIAASSSASVGVTTSTSASVGVTSSASSSNTVASSTSAATSVAVTSSASAVAASTTKASSTTAAITSSKSSTSSSTSAATTATCSVVTSTTSAVTSAVTKASSTSASSSSASSTSASASSTSASSTSATSTSSSSSVATVATSATVATTASSSVASTTSSATSASTTSATSSATSVTVASSSTTRTSTSTSAQVATSASSTTSNTTGATSTTTKASSATTGASSTTTKASSTTTGGSSTTSSSSASSSSKVTSTASSASSASSTTSASSSGTTTTVESASSTSATITTSSSSASTASSSSSSSSSSTSASEASSSTVASTTASSSSSSRVSSSTTASSASVATTGPSYLNSSGRISINSALIILVALWLVV